LDQSNVQITLSIDPFEFPCIQIDILFSGSPQPGQPAGAPGGPSYGTYSSYGGPT